jgi:hypothetical protein
MSGALEVDSAAVKPREKKAREDDLEDAAFDDGDENAAAGAVELGDGGALPPEAINEETLNRVLGENEYREYNLQLLLTLGMVNAKLQSKDKMKQSKPKKKRKPLPDPALLRRTSRSNIVKRNLNDRVLSSVCARCGRGGHSVRECEVRPTRQRSRRYDDEAEGSWELGQPDSKDGWD